MSPPTDPSRGAEVRRFARRIPAGVDRGARSMRPPSTFMIGVGLGVAGAVFLLLLIGVATHTAWLESADLWLPERASGLLRGHSTSIGLVAFARWIVSPPVGVLVAWAVAIVLARRGAWRLAAWLAVTPALTWLMALLVRALVGRSEPDTALIVAGTGFPSPYAAVSVATIGALLIVAVLSWPTWKWFARTLATAVLVLAAGSQLVLGLQTPIDIVGGWLLGVGVLGATCLSFGVSHARRLPVPLREARLAGTLPTVAVIYNPMKLASESDFRTLVSAAADTFDYEPPLFLPTTALDPGHAMATDAIAAGAALVLVAGGDGTVRAVCSELAETTIPVGIVAAGTGNLLARNLGIPLEQPEAIEVAFGGANRRIDLLDGSGDNLPRQWFAVMAGLGLDAAATEVGDRLKRQVGWMAYVVSGARHLSLPAVEVDISIDGAPAERFRARSVMVGNVGTLTGGVELIPKAQPDDGLLNVVVVAPANLIDWSRVGIAIVTKRHRGDEKLTFLTGASVHITVLDDEPVPRQLDGDVVTRGRRLSARVVPGVLTVRVPRITTNGREASEVGNVNRVDVIRPA
jgi:diacylglycerol kinase family enzyme